MAETNDAAAKMMSEEEAAIRRRGLRSYSDDNVRFLLHLHDTLQHRVEELTSQLEDANEKIVAIPMEIDAVHDKYRLEFHKLTAANAEKDRRIEFLVSELKWHRSRKADDRCIEDDDRIYEAIGDGIKCDRRVGDKAAMLKNCKRFIDQRCEAGGWLTYAELEAALAEKDRRIEAITAAHATVVEQLNYSSENYSKAQDTISVMQSVVDAAVKYRIFSSSWRLSPPAQLLRTTVDAYLATGAERQPLFTVVQEPDGHRTVLTSRDLIEAGQRASEDTAARDAEVKP